MKAAFILGSSSDNAHAHSLENSLGAESMRRYVCSAHKAKVDTIQDLVKELDIYDPDVVFTIAGMSNALSGCMAGKDARPHIACPPIKKKRDFQTDVHSSLRMPRDVPVATIINPYRAADFAKRAWDAEGGVSIVVAGGSHQDGSKIKGPLGITSTREFSASHAEDPKFTSILEELNAEQKRQIIILRADLQRTLTHPAVANSPHAVVVCPTFPDIPVDEYDHEVVNASYGLMDKTRAAMVIDETNAALFVLRILARKNPQILEYLRDSMDNVQKAYKSSPTHINNAPVMA